MAKATANPTVLLLFPCGATAWDEDHRLQGAADLPLSPAGRTAFAATVEHTPQARSLELVLHAPDEACVQCAALLTGAAGCKARTLPELASPKLGLWEGLRLEEAAERYTKAYKVWRDDPTAATPPDGDPLDAAIESMTRALRRAVDKAGKGRVGVVCRPVVAELLRRTLDSEPLRGLYSAAPLPSLRTLDPNADTLAALRTGAGACNR